MSNSVEERFLALFRSNPESFVIRKRVEATPDENGKREAEYTTLSRAVTSADVAAHFAGKTCLVLKPELPDGMCTWAMIDHDHYNEKTCALLREEIQMQKLPLHPFPSKSGGLHSAIFFRCPQPALKVRALLSSFAAQLGEPSDCEIFPKPVAPGKKPYGIAVPFFGAPEEFKQFEPNFCELPLNGDAPRGLENMEASDLPTYGIKLPDGADFGALLKDKLKFNVRHEPSGTSYDYHGIGGQPCLIQGSLHSANRGNPRCSRFFVKKGYVCHQCLDSDCRGVTEPKTRKALAALGLDFHAESATGRTNQATRLVELSGTAELFHSPDGTPYATIPVADHFQTWGIKSAGFKRWLAHKYYRAYGSAPNSQSLHDGVNVVSAKAQFDAPEHPVFIRVGGSDEKIYLDLCDDRWHVVEITSAGWQIMHRPPVKFRRASGALPLPVPVQGGNIAELRDFLNLNDDRDYALFFACLVAALRPRGPYPILVIKGEHGSAKSILARIMRALVDPYKAAIRSAPRAEDDLMVSAGCCHLAVFDNLSRLEDWLSDALCRLATGGGLAKRELYTDLDQVVLDVQRPVVINSIEDLVTHGDFLDRSVNLQLPPISDEKRQEERTLWDRFEKARPRILGALLSAVSAAIKNLPSVQIKRLPRMADFAVWAVAAEPALGLAKGSFLSAYEQNRAGANAVALESSRIATPLCRFANANGSWLGGVQELLEELSKLVSEDERRARHWPGSARGLRAALDRLIPNLRAEGINISYPDAKAARTRRALVQIQIANKDSEASDAEGSAKGLKGLKGCSQFKSSGQGSIQPGEDEESGDAVVI